MSFWGFVGILLILGVMGGALYMSKYATQKEDEIQQRKQKIRNLRNNLIDIDDLMHTLLIYDRNAELLQLFARQMEVIISDGRNLIPDDEDLKNDALDLEKINAQINALAITPEEPEIPASDRQIFLIKKQFIKAIKLIKQLHIEGIVDELTGRNHRARLQRNALVLEVQAYKKQAIEARDKGDTSSAANFYKHAKELLVNSEIQFADKTDQIQQVSRDISSLYVTPTESPKQSEGKKKSDN